MWTYEQVLANLVSKLREITGHEWIGPDTRLSEISDLDSLDLVEFVMHVEETFQCDLDSEDFARDRSVSTIALRIFDAVRFR